MSVDDVSLLAICSRSSQCCCCLWYSHRSSSLRVYTDRRVRGHSQQRCSRHDDHRNHLSGDQ